MQKLKPQRKNLRVHKEGGLLKEQESNVREDIQLSTEARLSTNIPKSSQMVPLFIDYLEPLR